MSTVKIAILNNALAEADAAWVKAEAAINAAYEAADSAYKACEQVRYGWKREEGDELYDAISTATSNALKARYRAKSAMPKVK